MDAQTIGNNAGKVWRLLDHNRKWEYNELKEATWPGKTRFSLKRARWTGMTTCIWN